MSNVTTHNPKAVARSGALYTATLVFQKILSFAYFTFVSRALGPDQLGNYIFALSFAAFFSLVVDFGFVPLAIRSFSQTDYAGRKKIFSTFFTIRVISAVLGVVLLFGTALVLGYDAQLLQLLAITSIIMVLDAFTAFFYTIFRSQQNLVFESIGTGIFQILIFLFGIYTITRTTNISMLLVVILVGSTWHLLYSAQRVTAKAGMKLCFAFHKKEALAALTSALPFFLAAGFIKASNTIDTILLKNLDSSYAVGLYAIPAKVVFTFPFIALAITAAVYPAMSNYAKHAKERLEPLFHKTMQLLLIISVPISVGIYFLADEIMHSIWSGYTDAIGALQILSWAIVFLYIEYPFGSLLNAIGKERRNTVNRGIQLCVFVASNLILIPLYGFMGAVYSALIGSVVIVVLGWLATREYVHLFNKDFVLFLLKLALAAFAMGEYVHWAEGRYNYLIIILVAALVYGILLFVLKVLRKEDVQFFRNALSKIT